MRNPSKCTTTEQSGLCMFGRCVFLQSDRTGRRVLFRLFLVPHNVSQKLFHPTVRFATAVTIVRSIIEAVNRSGASVAGTRGMALCATFGTIGKNGEDAVGLVDQSEDESRGTEVVVWQ